MPKDTFILGEEQHGGHRCKHHAYVPGVEGSHECGRIVYVPPPIRLVAEVEPREILAWERQHFTVEQVLEALGLRWRRHGARR